MILYYYLDVFYTHFLCFVFFVRVKSFLKKKFKTGLMTSFILLLIAQEIWLNLGKPHCKHLII